IEIITNAEVQEVTGAAGNFSVRVQTRPRYVDSAICTGCGFCSPYCPVTIPNPYDQNLSAKKAIDILYTQAVPSTYYVDPDHCLFLKKKECKQCTKACQAGAIDFSRKPETADYHVGAVVLAPGFRDINPALLSGYLYGKSPNVVTGVEFERISSASGPYQGKISRPSDLAKPRKIAIIQCAGSRSTVSGNSYCSSVCCKYAVKDAIVALEHEPDLDITIFFMDMRMYGKGLDAFYERAREAGITFVRSRIADIIKEETEDLTIKYIEEEGALKQETFNLVVLPSGLEPSRGTFELAKASGIRLNKYGFCSTDLFTPVSTSREGVFVAGSFREPVALPDSVIQASGAAAEAAELLTRSRGTMIRKKEFIRETVPDSDERRIGVFVCRCGKNIAGVVDTTAVQKYAAGLPDVVMSTENLYSCSEDAQTIIAERIAAEKLNRVVVAACTPRTHEPLFQETAREAGLNKCLFEMVNIRDQCSWVHSHEKEEATEKAKDLVRMAVAKARLIQPLDELIIDVIPTALVIGGGLSGMITALSLAGQGFECYIVERNRELGGNLRNLHYTLSGNNPQDYLAQVIDKVKSHERITVYTDAEIQGVDGFVGNFRTVLTAGDTHENIELHHGAVILATGAKPYFPDEYLFGKNKNVMLQSVLESKLARGGFVPQDNDAVVMIQCVGSRNKERQYCSSICCGMAVKNALKIKEMNPKTKVYILYRDMMMYGFLEGYYTRARNSGIVFIRYDRRSRPEVAESGGKITVTVKDHVLGGSVTIDAGLVALSTAVVPDRDENLEKALSVPRSSDGFYLESHVQLKPVDSYIDGIYICGMSHFPKNMNDAIAQAKAAASKAGILLSRGHVKAEPVVSSCDADKCIGCALCTHFCPYSAIQMVKAEKGKKADIIAAACKGCGVCASYCPAKAISMGRFTDEQINAQIEAFGASVEKGTW
ncbi:MAG: CoB--CoM heterodisulfide reductase iron-sulfur subunit A family protein, partial [Nitrospiraceae bacterium]